MDKNRVIPHGYMTVGELAKRMHVTVRTLQYYDKEGVLRPSAESEGGRRLYTERDMVRLHQILALKYLGFSIKDIGTRLTALDTPADVASALDAQADAVRAKIGALSEALKAIETLKAETLRMQSVDFQRYADIVWLLRAQSDMYWVVKHFDGDMLEHIRRRFDERSGHRFIDAWKALCDEAARLQDGGVAPGSAQAQAFAKAYWDGIMEFTGGDMSLLPKLLEFNASKEGWDEAWKARQTAVEDYITRALEAYFTALGYDPFEGVAT